MQKPHVGASSVSPIKTLRSSRLKSQLPCADLRRPTQRTPQIANTQAKSTELNYPAQACAKAYATCTPPVRDKDSPSQLKLTTLHRPAQAYATHAAGDKDSPSQLKSTTLPRPAQRTPPVTKTVRVN